MRYEGVLLCIAFMVVGYVIGKGSARLNKGNSMEWYYSNQDGIPVEMEIARQIEGYEKYLWDEKEYNASLGYIKKKLGEFRTKSEVYDFLMTEITRDDVTEEEKTLARYTAQVLLDSSKVDALIRKSKINNILLLKGVNMRRRRASIGAIARTIKENDINTVPIGLLGFKHELDELADTIRKAYKGGQ